MAFLPHSLYYVNATSRQYSMRVRYLQDSSLSFSGYYYDYIFTSVIPMRGKRSHKITISKSEITFNFSSCYQLKL